MNYDKSIIKALLALVEDYNKDNIAKERILGVFPASNGNESVVIKITTKGESNKGTPFYFGTMSTCIIAEYWNGIDLVWADMLYRTSDQEQEQE